MIVDELKQRIHRAAMNSQYAQFVPENVSDILVETPKTREYGHYSTNLPFILKKDAKRPPMEIAEKIAAAFEKDAFLQSIEPAKPGFINFRIAPAELLGEISRIRAADAAYGKTEFGAGTKVQVEFVSANPTGPLSVGHGRLAAFGDALASVMTAAGYDVQREFYVNDVGNQIKRLAGSMEKRLREALGEKVEFGEDDYKGAYLVEVARALLEKHGPALLDKTVEEREKIFARETIDLMLEDQRNALASFKVHFDNWFLESTLHEANSLERALAVLKEKGNVYENEGAVWFASTKYSDNEDRVLQKAAGPTTYFMSDIAYIKNKFDRGFDIGIYIWGADHHGYIERMKSAAAALGYDPARIEVLIVQLVRFKFGDEYKRMSKRAGNLVTLSDLVDEIGADVARFFFLMRTRESHLEFDLNLASDKSESNPLFYLQYAHARVCSILRKADREGLSADESHLGRLADPAELGLIKKLADFPWEIQTAAAAREPHRMITYLSELAAEFHAFYHDHRVIQEQEPELSSARLCLCDAVRIVFRNTLNLLGLDAPQEM